MQGPLGNLIVRLFLAALLLAGPSGPVVAIDTRLPDLGNSSRGIMSPARERELGKAFMRSVRRSQRVMDDPLLSEYIQDLGERLVANSGANGDGYHFFVVDNRQINAFAGPAGYIGVFTGLILTTDTESELASVMAHEIAHVTQQHLLRTWESAGNMGIPNAAILLAAVVLGAAVGGDAAAAAAAGGQAALIQQRINFTRDNEKEADRVGIDILAESGFEPRAMASFFSRMGKANRVYATRLPEYLQTHPVSTSRTADALGRAEQFPYRQNPDGLRYHLARMELTQRQIDQPEDAVRDLTLMLEDGRYRNETAVRYGLARSHLRAKQPEPAAEILDALLQMHPQMIEFIVSRAAAERQQGQHEQALARLAAALDHRPSSHALNMAYAEAALAAGRPGAAESQLNRYLAYRPEDPQLYQLLSRASGDQDKRIDVHAYRAEYFYLSGQLEEAVMQIDIALAQPDIDFYEASRLESRRAQIQQELDEQEAR
jgi:predicted Zn-dependent protease